MATYFISDLHLQPSHPQMAQGFLNFLENLQDADALYILGDFFEVWVGDDFDNPFVSAIKSALKALSERGINLFFMHGNRDFLVGEVFCKQTGATLLSDPSVITLGNQQAVLLHGDSLCTLDVAYMKTRQLIRNPMFQQQLLSKSIEERIALARQIRGESQSNNQMKSADIMDVTEDEVNKVMTEHNVNLMIHGHTHRPFDHHWQQDGSQRRRMVLGDWSDTEGWMIRFDEQNGFVLSQFSF